MDRRQFLMGAAALAASRPSAAAEPQFVKSICSIIFPDEMPRAECFRQAKAAGFDAIELRLDGELALTASPDQIKRVGDAARKAGIAIASLWVSEPLAHNPLNSDKPEERARGVQTIEKCIEWASYVGSGALLLIPGRVGSGPKFWHSYQSTWDRFSVELKKAIPAAEKARVLLTPENVWNKFLLSPLEMRAFVDQFHSPWLQTHFDVGNVMQYGYPEDWILTLGPRIKRVHFKDYKLSDRAAQGGFVDLLEGDVNWKAVMAALKQVGYRGYISPEMENEANDPQRLKNVSHALDRVLAMA